MLIVRVLRGEPRLPEKAYDGDAGYDVYAPEDIWVYANEIKRVALGYAIEIPTGWAAIVHEKSGLAMKGIFTIGNVIDSGYRGEIHVILVNFDKTVHREFKKGEKIAQIVLTRVYTGKDITKVANGLSVTSRGTGGFGSTGR